MATSDPEPDDNRGATVRLQDLIFRGAYALIPLPRKLKAIELAVVGRDS
jgi:hypothetical protein